jgi:hypothetical protein
MLHVAIEAQFRAIRIAAASARSVVLKVTGYFLLLFHKENFFSCSTRNMTRESEPAI